MRLLQSYKNHLPFIQSVYLHVLFFVGNEISKVDGLEGLQDLRELVLDRNKIKVMSTYSYVSRAQTQKQNCKSKNLPHPREGFIHSFVRSFIYLFIYSIYYSVYFYPFTKADLSLFSSDYYKYIICKSVERYRVAHGRKQVGASWASKEYGCSLNFLLEAISTHTSMFCTLYYRSTRLFVVQGLYDGRSCELSLSKPREPNSILALGLVYTSHYR